MPKATLAIVLAACLTGCGILGDGVVFTQKQSGEPLERAELPELPRQTDPDLFAIAFLDSIQAQSIAEQREFCGFFYRALDGAIRATPPVKGTFAMCRMPFPGLWFWQKHVASYHTHGAYGEFYDNEVPSVTDLNSDIRLGFNGYISTPGGRVWRVNHEERSTQQLCGLGCVTTDPGFVPRNESGVLPFYTIDQLKLRGGGY